MLYLVGARQGNRSGPWTCAAGRLLPGRPLRRGPCRVCGRLLIRADDGAARWPAEAVPPPQDDVLSGDQIRRPNVGVHHASLLEACPRPSTRAGMPQQRQRTPTPNDWPTDAHTRAHRSAPRRLGSLASSLDGGPSRWLGLDDSFEDVEVLFHAPLEQPGCDGAEMSGWSHQSCATDATFERHHCVVSDRFEGVPVAEGCWALSALDGDATVRFVVGDLDVVGRSATG
jgi:hypothetical protein